MFDEETTVPPAEGEDSGSDEGVETPPAQDPPEQDDSNGGDESGSGE